MSEAEEETIFIDDAEATVDFLDGFRQGYGVGYQDGIAQGYNNCIYRIKDLYADTYNERLESIIDYLTGE